MIELGTLQRPLLEQQNHEELPPLPELSTNQRISQVGIYILSKLSYLQMTFLAKTWIYFLSDKDFAVLSLHASRNNQRMLDLFRATTSPVLDFYLDMVNYGAIPLRVLIFLCSAGQVWVPNIQDKFGVRFFPEGGLKIMPTCSRNMSCFYNLIENNDSKSLSHLLRSMQDLDYVTKISAIDAIIDSAVAKNKINLAKDLINNKQIFSIRELTDLLSRNLKYIDCAELTQLILKKGANISTNDLEPNHLIKLKEALEPMVNSSKLLLLLPTSRYTPEGKPKEPIGGRSPETDTALIRTLQNPIFDYNVLRHINACVDTLVSLNGEQVPPEEALEEIQRLIAEREA